MARGFSATFGTGVNDIVTTGLTTGITGRRTYGLWAFEDGFGGPSGAGRYWDKGGEYLLFDTLGVTVFEFQVPFSVTSAIFTIQESALINAWHHHLITYDASSIANVPVWFVDGVSRTVTTQQGPVGTVNPNTTAFSLGNRPALDRVLSAKLAWFTVWDKVMLSAPEASLLGSGAPPWRVRPQSLIGCYPLDGYRHPVIDLSPYRRFGTLSGTKFVTGPPLVPPVPVPYMAPGAFTVDLWNTTIIPAAIDMSSGTVMVSA